MEVEQSGEPADSSAMTGERAMEEGLGSRSTAANSDRGGQLVGRGLMRGEQQIDTGKDSVELRQRYDTSSVCPHAPLPPPMAQDGEEHPPSKVAITCLGHTGSQGRVVDRVIEATRAKEVYYEASL